ncbi:CPBP family intramembrane metalloprotease [Merismopedia glauca CCAP 1448/3]|uniref:CPBP family intramembrane metalloprotease n=2 Tax=Merismopedia TaxID=53402 RepID=A0A2T1C249_9CYAN|nr:CPBP family intramembrane metalloprotease [Merismopedia glauca CCAP 1448/3]
MGVTSIVLLAIAQIWLYFNPQALLPVIWSPVLVLWGLAIGLGITLLSSLVYQIWPAYQQSADLYLELVLKPLIWSDLIWLGLLPGMSEELLFRGLLLPTLGLNWAGILISSFLFGILHLYGSQQWPYVVWATIVGGLLALSVVWTGNLLVPIVAHITTNFLAGCFWKISEKTE